MNEKWPFRCLDEHQPGWGVTGTVCPGAISNPFLAVVIFQCSNSFIDFYGLTYDGGTICPHFFTAGTTFGGLTGPRMVRHSLKMPKIGHAASRVGNPTWKASSVPYHTQIHGTT